MSLPGFRPLRLGLPAAHANPAFQHDTKAPGLALPSSLVYLLLSPSTHCILFSSQSEPLAGLQIYSTVLGSGGFAYAAPPGSLGSSYVSFKCRNTHSLTSQTKPITSSSVLLLLLGLWHLAVPVRHLHLMWEVLVARLCSVFIYEQGCGHSLLSSRQHSPSPCFISTQSLLWKSILLQVCRSYSD